MGQLYMLIPSVNSLAAKAKCGALSAAIFVISEVWCTVQQTQFAPALHVNQAEYKMHVLGAPSLPPQLNPAPELISFVDVQQQCNRRYHQLTAYKDKVAEALTVAVRNFTWSEEQIHRLQREGSLKNRELHEVKQELAEAHKHTASLNTENSTLLHSCAKHQVCTVLVGLLCNAV